VQDVSHSTFSQISPPDKLFEEISTLLTTNEPANKKSEIKIFTKASQVPHFLSVV
jgi:hypothetical protein